MAYQEVRFGNKWRPLNRNGILIKPIGILLAGPSTVFIWARHSFGPPNLKHVIGLQCLSVFAGILRRREATGVFIFVTTGLSTYQSFRSTYTTSVLYPDRLIFYLEMYLWSRPVAVFSSWEDRLLITWNGTLEFHLIDCPAATKRCAEIAIKSSGRLCAFLLDTGA